MPEPRPLPVVPFLKVPEGGDPYLEGYRCAGCDAVFLGARSVCSRCGSRDRMQASALSNRGTLYTYSIVFRSLPGIEVPFVSAVGDLEGGGTVKGNLLEVEAHPRAIRPGMAVSVVYRDAIGRKDKEGASYLSYFFVPSERAGDPR